MTAYESVDIRGNKITKPIKEMELEEIYNFLKAIYDEELEGRRVISSKEEKDFIIEEVRAKLQTFHYGGARVKRKREILRELVDDLELLINEETE